MHILLVNRVKDVLNESIITPIIIRQFLVLHFFFKVRGIGRKVVLFYLGGKIGEAAMIIGFYYGIDKFLRFKLRAAYLLGVWRDRLELCMLRGKYHIHALII